MGLMIEVVQPKLRIGDRVELAMKLHIPDNRSATIVGIRGSIRIEETRSGAFVGSNPRWVYDLEFEDGELWNSVQDWMLIQTGAMPYAAKPLTTPRIGDMVFSRSVMGELRMMRVTGTSDDVCGTGHPGFYGDVILPEVENPNLRKFWGKNSEIIDPAEVDFSEFRNSNQ